MNKDLRIARYRKNKIKTYYSNQSKNKVLVSQYQAAIKQDPIIKIIDNLATRACNVLKKNNIKRTLQHKELIGCTNDELKNQLEQLFADGMSFDNYGFWELDHITPISSFDLSKIDDQMECFNYKNIQPLWLKDNRSKGGA